MTGAQAAITPMLTSKLGCGVSGEHKNHQMYLRKPYTLVSAPGIPTPGSETVSKIRFTMQIHIEKLKRIHRVD